LKKKNKIILFLSIFSFLSLTWLIIDNTENAAATDFEPIPESPNQNFSWNFTIGDIIGFEEEVYWNGSKVSSRYYVETGGNPFILNITGFGYEEYGSSKYYFVNVDGLFYNANTSKLEIIPNANNRNFSLINFTNDEMYLNSIQPLQPKVFFSPPVNFFIPHNSSSLALEWCAKALFNTTYKRYFTKTIVNSEENEVRYYNNTFEDYISLKYFDNGTLEKFTQFSFNTTLYGTNMNLNITRQWVRTSNFNLVDEIEWGVDINDTLIYKEGEEIYKYKLVDFTKLTYQTISVAEARANAWRLNESNEWDLLYENRSIWVANEQSPIFFQYFVSLGADLLLIPSNFNTDEINQFIEENFLFTPDISLVLNENSIKIINDTSGAYLLFQRSDNGILTKVRTENFPVPFWNENLTLLCYNQDDFNVSVLEEETITLNELGQDKKFYVNINISVSNTTKLISSGSYLNPTYLKLKDSLLFLDLTLNRTDSLNDINISIYCHGETFDNNNLWWFNHSGNDGLGSWQEIIFTEIDDSTIKFNVDHLSVFALNGTTIDTISPTIEEVSSSNSDGIYKEGEKIDIEIVFSEIVEVTGTPQLSLETGITDAIVDYSSGAGSNTLIFTYTISPGHNSIDLDYKSSNALSLNGGSIKDKMNNDANLILPVPGTSGSLSENKDLIIDTTPPSLSIDHPLNMIYATDSITIMLSGDAENYWYYIAGEDSNNQTWSPGEERILSDGDYTLYAYGNDSAGNVAEESVLFSIDTTPPIFSIESPINTTYHTNIITVSLSGNAEIYWYYIEGLDTTYKIWNSDENRTLSEGTYILHAYGEDIVGNIAEEKSVQFTIEIETDKNGVGVPGISLGNSFLIYMLIGSIAGSVYVASKKSK